MAFLRSNPFSVTARFDYSIALTFAVPVREIAMRLPPGLEPDTYENEWGFLAVALVKTRGLRPKRLPPIFGRDFLLAGYRIFARYRSNDGRSLRGLYIIRSETDKPGMVRLGSLFTPYRYTLTDLHFEYSQDRFVVTDPQSGLHIEGISSGEEIVPLPEGSVFPDWRQARRFCGPMPFTFSQRPQQNEMLIIEGVRQEWTPRPVTILRATVPYLDQLEFGGARLSCAFIVRDVAYEWKRGRVEALPRS